ncbi:MAG: bifunctional nuclease family protein [Chitinispirillales bacterium]|jgi:bifunctional DNase/RNase|nr:bifunctional nuclease family protein [Chitinispirillales bacterium]
MIHVEVGATFLVSMGKDFVILLKGDEDKRTLPISIGQHEAQSIAIHLNQIPFPRPLTHDLFKSVVDVSGCTFLRTEICDLSDETFYARLVLEKNGSTVEIDSRPSDAIAIALRFSAPIYVNELVMDAAGIIIPEDAAPELSPPAAQTEEVSGVPLTPFQILQQKLTTAVEEERYEEAAILRDQMEKLNQSF